MKTITLIISAVLLSMQVLSQDIIYLKDGDVLESKIEKIENSKITYKKWSYQDGPSFTLYKSSVEKIKYSNGDTDDFHSTSGLIDYVDGKEKPGHKKVDEDPYRSVVGWRPFTPIYRSLGISYERMLKKNFGLKLPAIINFDGYYRVGVDVKYYVYVRYNRRSGRTDHALFIGPSVRTGTIGNLIEGGIDYYSSGYDVSQKTSLMLSMGGTYYLINNIGLEVVFGSGAMVDDYDIVPAISGGIFITCGF
ncbi:MAG: hypothetical protein ACE5DN_02000 [Flavobacteriales bacterium]